LGPKGQVTGSYFSLTSQESAELTEINLLETDSNKAWMRIDEIDNAKLDSSRRNIQIMLDFKGSMGNDEDMFSVSIDRKSGFATINYKYVTDCGDGRVGSGGNQDFICTAK